MRSTTLLSARSAVRRLYSACSPFLLDVENAMQCIPLWWLVASSDEVNQRVLHPASESIELSSRRLVRRSPTRVTASVARRLRWQHGAKSVSDGAALDCDKKLRPDDSKLRRSRKRKVPGGRAASSPPSVTQETCARRWRREERVSFDLG